MTYEAGVTALYKLRNNKKDTVYVQLTNPAAAVNAKARC